MAARPSFPLSPFLYRSIIDEEMYLFTYLQSRNDAWDYNGFNWVHGLKRGRAVPIITVIGLLCYHTPLPYAIHIFVRADKPLNRSFNVCDCGCSARRKAVAWRRQRSIGPQARGTCDTVLASGVHERQYGVWLVDGAGTAYAAARGEVIVFMLQL